MEVINISLDNIKKIKDELSLCLGYFDGLHLGHLELIKRALKSKYHSAVLTLEFSSDIGLKNKKNILTIEDKKNILERLGVEYLIVLKFTEEIKHLSSDDFVEELLIKLNPKELIVGKDYSFGYQAQGNNELLAKLSRGRYQVVEVKEILDGEKKISTREIIKYIENGEIDHANSLLSRFYVIRGEVEKGFHVGSVSLYPTANVEMGNYVIPRFGVYSVLVRVDDCYYMGMANIGVHPTINELQTPILEVNLFDFNGNIYNKEIEVSFISFIRDEKKFSSVDDLKKQLDLDEEHIKNDLKRFYDCNEYLIPYLGVKEYHFRQKASEILVKFSKTEKDLLKQGPTYECDEVTKLLKLDDAYLLFSEVDELMEIDYFSSDFALFNGIRNGMSLDEAKKIDRALIKTSLEGVYLSLHGYSLMVNESKIFAISLYDHDFFDKMIFFDEEREKIDLTRLRLIESVYKEYEKGNLGKEDLINAFLNDVSLTHEFIHTLPYASLAKLSDVINNYYLIGVKKYEDYVTDEVSLISETLEYFQKKLKSVH